MFQTLLLICWLCTQSVHANDPFTGDQISQMRGYFEANIGLSNCAAGFVVASPSGGPNHTSGDPDYYYHWQRDAAVTMQTLLYTSNNSNAFDSKFKAYVKWIQSAQTVSDPNNMSVFGEPKFNCDGSVYSKGWCRPQNDGPASRAVAQITYANYLLDQGEKDYVITNLYSPSSTNNSVTCTVDNQHKMDCGYIGINQTQCIQKGCCWKEIDHNPSNYPWCYHHGKSKDAQGIIANDLNYVIQVWDNGQSCDLWEEVRGTLFYTTMVQRYALYYGATLAKRLNDTQTADKWEKVASSIDDTIKTFENNGTIQDFARKWDCSVILAALYGGTPDKFQPNMDEMFPPTNLDVLNTISQIKSYWDGAYTINKEDDANNIPGTLIGRYANDKYTGCNNAGGSEAHAWILCSNALADIYYRNALYLYENRLNAKQLLTPQHITVYADLFEKDQPTAASELRRYVSEWTDGNDVDYVSLMQSIAQMAARQGDNQLQRVSYHVGLSCGNEYHLSEQICELGSRNGGGKEIGAHDLTWSYATVLSAWYYRSVVIERGIKFYGNWTTSDAMVSSVAKQNCGDNLCGGQCLRSSTEVPTMETTTTPNKTNDASGISPVLVIVIVIGSIVLVFTLIVFIHFNSAHQWIKCCVSDDDSETYYVTLSDDKKDDDL